MLRVAQPSNIKFQRFDFAQSLRQAISNRILHGALTDPISAAKERPGVAERVWRRLIPGYAEKNGRSSARPIGCLFRRQNKRPCLDFAGRRGDVGSQAPGLAGRLQSLGKTYELHIYAGDDHPLNVNRQERERKIVEWFKGYTK